MLYISASADSVSNTTLLVLKRDGRKGTEEEIEAGAY